MARTNVRGSQVADNTIVLTPGLGQDVTGTLPVANGGTGGTTFLLNALLVGNGTGGLLSIAPGPAGYVLTSDGTAWAAQKASGGGASTPLRMLAGETFTIPTRKQVVIGTVITLEAGAEVVIEQGAELIKAGAFTTE